MSVNILQLDLQEGLTMAWHGLTHVRPKISLDSCWLAQWDIERVPMYVRGKQTPFDMLECTDNAHLIGKPIGKSYGMITNRQFLDMINSAIGGTAHKITSVGSLRNRGRVFVTIKLDQDTLTRIGRRQFQDYLTAGTSHDQSCELFWMNSSTCTVCDNTFSWNLAQVRKAVDLDEQDEDTTNARIRHSKNAALRLPSIADIIDKAVGARAEFYFALNEFSKQPCTVQKAEQLFCGFEASKEAKELATITRRRVNDELYLFSNGRGNEGKTILDVFSAGTDLYTHSHTGGDMQRQWEASEYGSGAKRKQALFTALKDQQDSTARRGEALLKASVSQFE